jgi:predicted nucleic acid-binding protein
MIAYLDTSCLVKIYVREIGTELVHNKIEQSEFIFTSIIAYPETRAALARRNREGVFKISEYKSILKSFERDWKEMSVLIINEDITKLAGHLAEKYALRGLNSVHLASAVFIKKRFQEDEVIFLCSDQKLNFAAYKEGFHEIIYP